MLVQREGHLDYLGPFMNRIIQRRKQRRGQTLVEYALIHAFISIVAITVLIALGKSTGAIFSVVNSNLANAVSSH